MGRLFRAARQRFTNPGAGGIGPGLAAIKCDVVTKAEIVRLDNKIDVAVRDLTIRMGGVALVLFGALASIKFFG
jgi:hypothetical protein